MTITDMIRKTFEQKAQKVGYRNFRQLGNESYFDLGVERAWILYRDLIIESDNKLQEELEKVHKNIQRDAAIGNVAMKFMDRAGDVHPGIDDAEKICAEFHAAMMEEFEKWLHPDIKANKINIEDGPVPDTIFTLSEYTEKDKGQCFHLNLYFVENKDLAIETLSKHASKYFAEPKASQIVETYKLLCSSEYLSFEMVEILWCDINHEVIRPIIDEYYQDEVIGWNSIKDNIEFNSDKCTFADHLEYLRRFRMTCEIAFDLAFIIGEDDLVIIGTASDPNHKHEDLKETGDPLFKHNLASLPKPEIDFYDPRVQKVYEILTDDESPPEGEHWEGFASMKIIKALTY